MKTEVIIGQKPDLKKLLLKIIIYTILFYMLYLLMTTMFQTTKFVIENPNFLIGIRWTFLVMYIIIMLVILTGISIKQYIIINDLYFRFYASDGFLSQIEDTFLILFHKERKSLIEIPITNIKKLTLLYSDVQTSYYFKGHTIIYCLELKNGNIVKINPDSFDFSNDSILKGIEFIKNKGIEMNDPYHLIQGLQSKDMRLSDYIDKVVIKNEHHL